ncbi:MAG: hypothetical protein RRY34_02955 [Victivallaceae bacterium]
MNKYIVYLIYAGCLGLLLCGCTSTKDRQEQLEQTGGRELSQYTKLYRTLPLKSTSATQRNGIRNLTYREKLAFISDSKYLGFTNVVLQIGNGKGDQILHEAEALIYCTSVISDYTNIHYGITPAFKFRMYVGDDDIIRTDDFQMLATPAPETPLVTKYYSLKLQLLPIPWISWQAMPFRGDYFAIPKITGINIRERAHALSVSTAFFVQPVERLGEISNLSVQSDFKETSTTPSEHTFKFLNNTTIYGDAVRFASPSAGCYSFSVPNSTNPINFISSRSPKPVSVTIPDKAAADSNMPGAEQTKIQTELPFLPEIAIASTPPNTQSEEKEAFKKKNYRPELPAVSLALKQPAANMQLVPWSEKFVREGKAQSQYFDWTYKFEFTTEFKLHDYQKADSGWLQLGYTCNMERVRFFANDKFTSGSNGVNTTISLVPENLLRLKEGQSMYPVYDGKTYPELDGTVYTGLSTHGINILERKLEAVRPAVRTEDGNWHVANLHVKYQAFATSPALCKIADGSRKNLNDTVRIDDEIILKIIVSPSPAFLDAEDPTF